ncbi:hypothetical protein AMJ87_03395 [candidate division WOR_3 bacterium SM23_60]|uniref:Uncharacterized protein n=1 Tax=candidate division WOR_3 bacterium SM23_60 TaxID=1703780 RepID=A0A0S8GKC8_UNCW3|nr:MAG: hypothetical protein AMJ87_03395 [candidate division WOR_3 bacterium SM23_60]
MMKKALMLFVLITLCIVHCTEEEEPLYCHVYGWVRTVSDSTGVNGLILKIIDLDPENLPELRQRQVTTQTHDLLAGFFEIDSVVYGTDQRQGTAYVTFIADSLDNPDWPHTVWNPNVYGDVDTTILYISQ